MRITKHGRRFWAVYDETDALVCLCVYKKGALEVVRRLLPVPTAPRPDPQKPRRSRSTPTRPISYDAFGISPEEKTREPL